MKTTIVAVVELFILALPLIVHAYMYFGTLLSRRAQEAAPPADDGKS